MLVEKFGDNVFLLGNSKVIGQSATTSCVVVVGGLRKSPKVKRHAQRNLWSAFRSGNQRLGRAGKRGALC